MDNRNRHTIIILVAIALSALVLVTCCRRSSDGEVVRSVPPCEITAGLDSLMESLFPSDNEPGGILVVMRGDSIAYEYCRGMARLDSTVAITPNTVFNLCSTSKMFTSAAVLKLVEEGTISLEDSLTKFFPEFPSDVFGKIKLRHILTHTSGLPDMRPANDEEWDAFIKENNTIYGDFDTYRFYGRASEYMKAFNHLNHTLFEPGTHFELHDPSFMLLTPLIERVTGDDFNSWMEHNIFEPAGLSNSIHYYQTAFNSADIAHGYSLNEEANKHADRWQEADFGEVNFFITRADRGAYGTANDVLHFLSVVLQGKILSQATLDEAYTPRCDATIPNVHFGFGCAILTEPGMPLKRYHMYNNGGFQSIEASWPGKDVSYVLLSNRNDWNYRKTASRIDHIIANAGWLH